MPPMPQPQPLPPPPPEPPAPPVNPRQTTTTMAPAQVSGGLPTLASNEYTRRGRGKSALTIPMAGGTIGGLNIPTGA